jgi:outer membrane protein OmpA-like peptidoglycan-associated protein
MTDIRTCLKPTIAVSAALLLSACGLQLGAAKNTTAPGSAFESGLHQGYLDLSQAEYNESDYEDSDKFAKRTIAVSRGQSVAPEEISARALPSDHVDALSGARSRLVSALDATARTKVPGPAARAQVMFDCWMQEQEENFQPKDIARCRGGFEAAMAAVDDAMRPPPPPPPPPRAAVPEPVEEMMAPRSYTIFFDFDSESINPPGQAVIEAILADWGSGLDPVSLVGHADASGPAVYNVRLSDRRMRNVGTALRDGGMSGSRVGGRAVGEADLMVPTPDGEREPRNRRVTVTIE